MSLIQILSEEKETQVIETNKLLSDNIWFLIISQTILKVILIVKSSGCLCLQIGFGPLIIDYICNFFM